MPSPIAHVAAGYVLFAFFRKHLARAVATVTGRGIMLFAVCILFSLLPDFDAVPGALAGDMGLYHNQWTHSIVWAAGLAAIIALAMYRIKQTCFWGWFALFFSCYGVHILLDFVTYGRGLRLFWPFGAGRYRFEPALFGGLRWSEGFFSKTHLWTALEEISFAVLLMAAYYAIELINRLVAGQGERGENCCNADRE